MIDRICLTCDCYDPDYECTMSGLDRSYACPLCSDPDDVDESEQLRRSVQACRQVVPCQPALWRAAVAAAHGAWRTGTRCMMASPPEVPRASITPRNFCNL